MGVLRVRVCRHESCEGDGGRREKTRREEKRDDEIA